MVPHPGTKKNEKRTKRKTTQREPLVTSPLLPLVTHVTPTFFYPLTIYIFTELIVPNKELNQRILLSLLMFPGINKSVYEYLVLEVDPISKKMIWKRLEYKFFLIEIFKLCRKIGKKYTIKL